MTTYSAEQHMIRYGSWLTIYAENSPWFLAMMFASFPDTMHKNTDSISVANTHSDKGCEEANDHHLRIEECLKPFLLHSGGCTGPI